MDIYEILENKVKEFVRTKYQQAIKYAETAEDVIKCRAIAYGALEFSANNLFPCYNDKLARWWDKYWDKFNQLALDKQK